MVCYDRSLKTYAYLRPVYTRVSFIKLLINSNIHFCVLVKLCIFKARNLKLAVI